MERFQEGDKVQVPSGGPVMTVETVDAKLGIATCVWFDEKNKPCKEGFNIFVLVKVPEYTEKPEEIDHAGRKAITQ